MVGSKRSGGGVRKVAIGLILFAWPIVVLSVFGAFSAATNLLITFPDQIELEQYEALAVNIPVGPRDEIFDTLAFEQHALATYGTGIERQIFDRFSLKLLRRTASEYIGGLSLLGTIRVKLYLGLINLVFMLLLSARAILIAAIGAAIYGYFRGQAFLSPRLFGALNDGRYFSSALSASSVRMHHSGHAEMQVASPLPLKLASEREALKSGLGELLLNKGVINSTNLFLARALVGAREQPAYCAQLAEQSLLEHYFEGASVLDDATAVLRKALHLHGEYCTGSVGNDDLLLDKIHESIKAKAQDFRTTGDFILELECLLHRVLQPPMRDELALIPSAHITTLVLASKVGALLRRRHDGAKWYGLGDTGLAARAALNAVPSLAEEYDPLVRGMLRHALLFGEPGLTIEQLKLPADMSDGARAMRQWAALIACCPHDIVRSSENIELFGLSAEIERRWAESFLDALAALDPFVVRSCVVGADGSVLAPIDVIIQLSKGRIPSAALERTRELCYAVYARKLDENNIKEGLPRSWSTRLTPATEFFKPLATTQFADLLEQHGVAREDIQNWEALRYVLGSFGWLRTAFGDSSIVERAALIVECQSKSEKTRLVGMWPLDSILIGLRFGSNWRERFDAYSNPVVILDSRRGKDRKRSKPFLRAVSSEKKQARGGVA